MTIDYRDAKLLWPGLYKAIHEILGDAHVIVPFGDELVAGKVNATSFEAKAMGATAPSDLTWTPSEALSAFDVPLDLTDPDGWQGIAPVLSFNATDEELETPDDGFYSRNDASGEAFSIGAWVHITDSAAARNIMAKWDTGVAIQEWRLRIDGNDFLSFICRDDSAAVEVSRVSDAAIPAGRWIFVSVTYDGAGGTNAMDGATLYVDGVAVASSASNNGSYVAMEGGTSAVFLGTRHSGGAGIEFFNGKMAGGPIGPFFCQKELTATEVLDLYHIGAHAQGLA